MGGIGEEEGGKVGRVGKETERVDGEVVTAMVVAMVEREEGKADEDREAGRVAEVEEMEEQEVMGQGGMVREGMGADMGTGVREVGMAETALAGMVRGVKVGDMGMEAREAGMEEMA